MDSRFAFKRAEWGFLIALATVTLSLFGPAVGGGTLAYLEGPSRREGAKLGAQGGFLGAPLFIGVINRYGLYETIHNSASGPPLGVLLAGVFLYIVVCASIGGYVGATLRESHGESEPSRTFERTKE